MWAGDQVRIGVGDWAQVQVWGQGPPECGWSSAGAGMRAGVGVGPRVAVRSPCLRSPPLTWPWARGATSGPVQWCLCAECLPLHSCAALAIHPPGLPLLGRLLAISFQPAFISLRAQLTFYLPELFL